jgi:SAM-dependent methyltransferase
MADQSNQNPLSRFNGLANVYAHSRPDYPRDLIDFLVACCSLDGDSLIVDVGCGTGISSRLFAVRGIPVIGIEPNQEMRKTAEAELWDSPFARPTYQPGQAEATGLADQVADLVLAAQAFHWFQPEPALREFHRLLKPAGWTALVWNERDEADPFTATYGKIVRNTREAAGIEGSRGKAGMPLLTSPLFQKAERLTFRHEQVVDQEGLLGRAFSASYAPRDPGDRKIFAEALQEVFARFQKDKQVTIVYETSLYLAQKYDS